jgi:nitroimidazol reductase NimA-like FMN-containing flavoprotein (pyridoxamine 5'-phosphate oxidase superfamily)
MWYGLIDDKVVFWSYAKAQKIVNLRRNPQLAIQIEEGEHPSEVRGVEIEGAARFLDDPEEIAAVGRAVLRQGFAEDPTDEALELAGVRKRAAVVIEPVRIATWDHRKIEGGYLAGALPKALK